VAYDPSNERSICDRANDTRARNGSAQKRQVSSKRSVREFSRGRAIADQTKPDTSEVHFEASEGPIPVGGWIACSAECHKWGA
jgi:hypothetical protein